MAVVPGAFGSDPDEASTLATPGGVDFWLSGCGFEWFLMVDFSGSLRFCEC